MLFFNKFNNKLSITIFTRLKKKHFLVLFSSNKKKGGK